MALPSGLSCNCCEKALKARQIAVQCDHCDYWHTLLGSGGLKEIRQTTEGFRLFSFPAVHSVAGDDVKPSIFIFIQNSSRHNGDVPSFGLSSASCDSSKENSNPLTYQLHNSNLLKDNAGFFYTQHEVHNGTTMWRCVVTRATSQDGADCPAAVAQQGNTFTQTHMAHNHAVSDDYDDDIAPQDSKSGITCEISQEHVSCRITDAQITPVQLDKVEKTDPEVTYRIVEGGTIVGTDVLIDSLGYTYRRKMRTGEQLLPGGPRCRQSMLWRCCVNNARTRCRASVSQRGDIFWRGRHSHIHPAGNAEARAIAISTKTDRASLKRLARLKRQAERKPKTENWPLRKDDGELTYELMESFTRRNGSLLLDSLGFTYTIKRERKLIRWRCTRRSAKETCHACIVQVGESFIPGRYAHIHPPNGDVFRAINAIKTRVISQFFRSITEIVDEVIAEYDAVDIKRNSMIRIASKHRQNALQDAGDAVTMEAAPAWEETVISEDVISNTISSLTSPVRTETEPLSNASTSDQTLLETDPDSLTINESLIDQ